MSQCSWAGGSQSCESSVSVKKTLIQKKQQKQKNKHKQKNKDKKTKPSDVILKKQTIQYWIVSNISIHYTKKSYFLTGFYLTFNVEQTSRQTLEIIPLTIFLNLFTFWAGYLLLNFGSYLLVKIEIKYRKIIKKSFCLKVFC